MVVDGGFTVPVPSVVIVTPVASPPKVFPVTVTGVVPHVVPLLPDNVTIGGFKHAHATGKLTPVVVQPDGFITEIV